MTDLEKNVARNKKLDGLFAVVGLLSTFIGMLTLAALIVNLAIDGAARLTPHFFTSFPSRFPAQAGILSAWVGTTLVMAVTALAAVPMGIAAGVYLEEYAPKNWLTALIEINIANLAGVPSIVYGLMALGLFVYQLKLGQSILSAGLTLALLILPIVIVATRDQFAVPGACAAACASPPVANHPGSRSTLFPRRDFNGRHHRLVARHRRNRTAGNHWRPDLHRVPAGRAGQRRISLYLL
jgi:phosphate transport system permease protein